MSILFSRVTTVDEHGKRLSLWESGAPDRYDLQELLEYERRYAKVKQAALHGAKICVTGYRFQTGGRDWLAELDHFALMDAYDHLAKRHKEKSFLQMDRVERLGSFSIYLADTAASSDL